MSAPLPDPDLVIDRQNEGSGFQKFCHVLALPYLLMLRRDFGTAYLKPIWLFYKVVFAGIIFSALLCAFKIFTPGLSLAIKVSSLFLFISAKAGAEFNLMRSQNPRHPNDSGRCRLIKFFPKATKWRMRIKIEPLCVLVFSLITLSLGGVLGAISMFYREVRAYRDWSLSVGGPIWTMKEIMSQFADPRSGLNTGQPFNVPTAKLPTAKPSTQQMQPATGVIQPLPRIKGNHPLPSPHLPSPNGGTTPNNLQPSTPPLALPSSSPNFFGRIASFLTGQKPQIPSMSPPVSKQSPSANHKQQATFTKKVTRSTPQPSTPATSPEEQAYSRILNMPQGGFQDAAHLRECWRKALQKYHPDRTQDEAKKTEANRMTRQVNEAYAYFKSRIEEPIGLQKPLT